MIELRLLNQRGTGRSFRVEAAPVRLGRRPGLDVVVAEPGVWDFHAKIEQNSAGWLIVMPQGQAIISVNDLPALQHRLRQGDVLTLGSARLQFSVGSAPLKPLRFREWSVWTMIVAVVLAGAGSLVFVGG